MDNLRPTPGLHEALTYLDSLRAVDPEPIADIPDNDGGDDTLYALADQVDVKPQLRHSPDELLNALAIMRLCHAAEQAGPDLMSPGPGFISVLVVPSQKDQERVARRHPDLWRRMSVPLPALVIDDPLGRSSAIKDLHHRIEGRLMSGSGVFAILTGTTSLPSELEGLVTKRVTLPPMTGRMLAAVLEYVHPGQDVEVRLTDQQLGKLSPVALAPVLAAETLDAAVNHLYRLGSMPQSLSDGPSLDDVYGQPEAVDALRQVVSDLDAWRAGNLPWRDVTKSFLLTGPPGTGKTMLAEALARSAGITLVKTSYADVQKRGHQGDALKALNEAAERAKTDRPAAFFLDEVDSFYDRNQSSNGYIIGMVNGLLTLIDGLSATEGVVLIAATNDPERVDPAVVRAGRFDRHIRVGRPIRSGITAMLSAAVAGIIPEPDLDRVSEQLVGLSGAEVAALLRAARTAARKAGRDLALEDLQAAADRVQPKLGDALMRRVAVHEAAHVIAGYVLGLPAATLARISPRGGEVVRPHLNAMTARDIRGMIAAVLAGREAEDLIFGDVTSGGGIGLSSDLAQATSLGIRAECAWGFGASLCWISPDTPITLLPDAVRVRVEARLRAGQEDARRVIAQHRGEVERVADALLELRELDGAALAGLLDGVQVQADGAGQFVGGLDA
jgi:Cdc6-like AAA superfamily ATPase